MDPFVSYALIFMLLFFLPGVLYVRRRTALRKLAEKASKMETPKAPELPVPPAPVYTELELLQQDTVRQLVANLNTASEVKVSDEGFVQVSWTATMTDPTCRTVSMNLSQRSASVAEATLKGGNHTFHVPMRHLPDVEELRLRLWDESRKEACANAVKHVRGTP